MVTTAADLTVIPVEDGITIIYKVDPSGQELVSPWTSKTTPSPERTEMTYQPRELTAEDLDICYDRGRNLDHLSDLPITVRDTACAYLYIHLEDENFRVYLRPTLRLNIDLYEILGTVDGELL